MASERVQQTAAPAVNRRGSGWTSWRDLPRPERWRLGGFVGYLLLLTLAFIQPLTRLTLYAARSDLNSHVLVVLFINGYLLYSQRGRVLVAYRSSIAGTITAGGIGFGLLASGIAWRGSLSVNDGLALAALAFVSFITAAALELGVSRPTLYELMDKLGIVRES